MTDRIDRYVRGELSPQEARMLAQQSLEAPELFDELTGDALAKVALNSRTVRRANVLRTWRRTAVLTGGLIAAAVIVAIALPHSSSRRAPHIRAALDPASNQPILLASGLYSTSAAVFRGDEPDGRAPKSTGSIVSVEDHNVNLNLGSLDGLEKGSELEVFRGSDAVGRLQVTAVFRDRARAGALEGKRFQVKDEVRVGGADHLNALRQQVEAAFHRGESDAAFQLAEEAVRWGEAAGVPADSMAVSWNQLAVMQLLRGDSDGAERRLLHAASAAAKTNPAYCEVQNNLGILAELRGERAKAAASYSNALSGAREQRQTVERNLERVRSLR